MKSFGDIKFYPDVFSALSILAYKFYFFIITNQTGVGKGVITKDDVEDINSHIVGFLAGKGIIIKEVFSCYHKREDNCMCIKPKPYFLYKASEKYNIDLRTSFVIGDHLHDIELAKNVNATGIYLLTGHGREHEEEIPNATIVSKNIYNASLKILNMIV